MAKLPMASAVAKGHQRQKRQQLAALRDSEVIAHHQRSKSARPVVWLICGPYSVCIVSHDLSPKWLKCWLFLFSSCRFCCCVFFFLISKLHVEFIALFARMLVPKTEAIQLLDNTRSSPQTLGNNYASCWFNCPAAPDLRTRSSLRKWYLQLVKNTKDLKALFVLATLFFAIKIIFYLFFLTA